jgi:hypothetical protein
VSRGAGRAQRRALHALWNDEGRRAAGMPLAEVRRAIGADRSNARRAIRGLVERGLIVEVTDDEGVRRVKLTGGALLAFVVAQRGAEPLTPERVPGRPLNLDREPLDGNPLSLGIPLESSPAAPDRPVSAHDDEPMQGGVPHADTLLPPDQYVTDNSGDDAMQVGASHATAPLPPDRPVSDLARRVVARRYAVPVGLAHASGSRTPHRGVSDPPSHSAGSALGVIARLAAEALERKDQEEGREPKA